MSDTGVSISGLPEANPLDGTEQFAVVQGGQTKRASVPTGGSGGDGVPSPHTIGGLHHSASTLVELNALISDATLDDKDSARPPTAHTHDYAATQHTHPVSDVEATGTADATTFLRGDGTWAIPEGGGGGDVEGGAPSPHSLGGSHHSADTLANLNAKISDATLDDASAARPPIAHEHDYADPNHTHGDLAAVDHTHDTSHEHPDHVTGDGVTNIRRVTQAEYNALTPNPETLYLVVG